MKNPKKTARTNQERREETRQALLAAARKLFAKQGYAATSTPEIVKAAGLTRGALYYHFTDKRDVFRAVLESEQSAIMTKIESRTGRRGKDPVDALVRGSRAFLEAAADPATMRIVFIDGPAVLGRQEWLEVDRRYAAGSLRAGLEAAMAAGAVKKLPLDPLADVMSAAFNEAALVLREPGAEATVEGLVDVFRALFDGLRVRGKRKRS